MTTPTQSNAIITQWPPARGVPTYSASFYECKARWALCDLRARIGDEATDAWMASIQPRPAVWLQLHNLIYGKLNEIKEG